MEQQPRSRIKKQQVNNMFAIVTQFLLHNLNSSSVDRHNYRFI
jgi:hypothetical protein